MNIHVALLSLALVSGCGGGASSVLAPGGSGTPTPPAPTAPTALTPSATSLPIPTTTPTPPTQPGPQFATPEAAMRYLASAWNRGDLVSLKHVTDPAARTQLLEMHREATNLALDHCTFTKSRGDYECFFTHGFPKGYKSEHGATVGTAEFTVGPARKPGWYMTFFIDCGG